MEKARAYHAVVEDVALFCPGIVGQTNKKQSPSPQTPSSQSPRPLQGDHVQLYFTLSLHFVIFKRSFLELPQVLQNGPDGQNAA